MPVLPRDEAAQPVAASHGLQQSLLVLRQRHLLDAIGAEVGTPVVYLKAAWADPVLYGGRGARTGGDVDVFVHPRQFVAFARALERHGFSRYREAWHMATHRLFGKAWLFVAPPQALAVDLHRELVDRPWFSLPPEACLERARCYDSVDGPILSLCPEDQLIYAAAHYASHRYTLGRQHLEDIRRLLVREAIDWDTVRARADACHLGVPLTLLLAAAAAPLVDANTWRAAVAEACLDLDADLRRAPELPYPVEALALMPLLSTRTTALPRYLARAALAKTLDGAEELWHRARAAHERFQKNS